MDERENLPAVIAAQAVAVLVEKSGSLVGRGLMALKKDNDVLYRQARAVFDRGNGIENWNSAKNPAIFSIFKILQQLANENYGKAYFPLFWLYKNRRDVEDGQNLAQHFVQLAFDWCFANQANQDVELWCDLGAMYSSGMGVKEDKGQAVYWLHKAAEQGYALAQFGLGMLYSGRRGVPQDDKLAVYWIEKAAEQGYEMGQWELGCMYSEGRGVAKDNELAGYWYRKAAEQGDAQRQWKLGDRYMTGHGVAKGYEQAKFWRRKAAEQGDANYQYGLGRMLFWTGDNEQAMYWFRKAAEQGNVDGQWFLGRMFGEGRGVPQDKKQGEYWYRKAAEQGDVDYQRQLGRIYAEGFSVEQNDEQAVYWYRQATEQGNHTGQLHGTVHSENQ